MTPANHPNWGGPRRPGPGKRMGRAPLAAGTRRFSITLAEADVAWLDTQAQTPGETRGEVIRRLIGETQDRQRARRAMTAEWFEQAFTDPVTGQPYDLPRPLRIIAERLCMAYGISGICDPMYIANLIARELGLGDGQSTFYDPPTYE